MNAGFDKFSWLNAIRSDEDLAAGIKFLLQNIALVYMRHGGTDELYARQIVIAEQLGVSDRQIRRAYADARDRHYFVLVERGRGRGREVPDRYRLVIPAAENPDSVAGNNSEKPDRVVRNKREKNRTESAEKPDRVVRNNEEKPDSFVQKTGQFRPQPPTLTSENEPSQGEEQGDKYQGEEQGGGGENHEPPNLTAVPDSADVPLPAFIPNGEIEQWIEPTLGGITPPSPYCAQHPNGGTEKDCGPCGGRRRHRERWDRSEAGIEWNYENDKRVAMRLADRHQLSTSERNFLNTQALKNRQPSPKEQRIMRTLAKKTDGSPNPLLSLPAAPPMREIAEVAKPDDAAALARIAAGLEGRGLNGHPAGDRQGGEEHQPPAAALNGAGALVAKVTPPSPNGGWCR